MNEKVQWVNLLLGGGVGAIIIESIRAVRQRRKMDADAAHILTETATSLLGPLRDRIRELEEQVRAAKIDHADQMLAAKKEADALKRELFDARIELAEARTSVRELREEVQRHQQRGL